MGQLLSLNHSSKPLDASTQTLCRALDILEIFLSSSSDLSVGELADLTKLSRTTVHRLASTLEARGYLQRDAETRRYGLGVRVFELGARFHNQQDIRKVALPELTSLVEQTGQGAFLCVRDGDEALCVERVGGRHRVRIFALQVGERQPLHCGAAPRALLAGFADAEVIAYSRRTGLAQRTVHSLSSPELLIADVRRTRTQGYVLSNEDVTLGVAAIGAPVYDQSGQVTASISVSGLAATYTPERIAELADVVRTSAERLSALDPSAAD